MRCEHKGERLSERFDHKNYNLIFGGSAMILLLLVACQTTQAGFGAMNYDFCAIAYYSDDWAINFPTKVCSGWNLMS